LSATFMNYHGLLSGYAFGEAAVSLGVKIGADTFVPTVANCTAIHGTTVYTGHSTAPYLKADGVATAEQPTFPVHCIVVYEGEILCIGSDGQTWTSAGFAEPVSASDFMTAKYVAMAASHLGYDFTGGVLSVCNEYGAIEIYEFAPLGTFKIDTPKKRNINLISAANAYDGMRKFDVDASDFFDGLTYPITLGDMFEELCTVVGVTWKTSTFTNSDHAINSAPTETDKITAKDILKWIAEAAGSFARMTRDNEVELAWFTATGFEIPYAYSVDIADYAVSVVDKLEILNAETGINGTVGNGTNSYLIINNPFLKGVTPGDVYNYGLPIYNKLHAFAAFRPMTATAACDWSIQAGDIIMVEHDEQYYALPVYVQTITWRSDCRVVYESTGSEKRPILDAATRTEYMKGKELYEVKAGVEDAVKQGEAYNDVEITHADGVVCTATIGGKTITIKMNGQNGLAVYDGATYKGGVAVVNGEVSMVGSKLMNDINGDCYATIGTFTDGGVTYTGIFIYRQVSGTFQLAARFIVDPNGGIHIRDRQSKERLSIYDGTGYAKGIYIKGENGVGRFSLTEGEYGSCELRTPGDRIVFTAYDGTDGVQIRYDNNNRIGVDPGGPFYIKGGVKTYF
jgi:hypothetical protein